MNAKDFIPEGRTNHYLHPEHPGTIFVLREGMTLDEFIVSLDEAAGRVPELGLPPRDLAAELDDLKARLAKAEGELAALKTDPIPIP